MLQSITPSAQPLKKGDIFAVYGTLRVGCGNYAGLRMSSRAKHLGQDLVEGSLYHLGGCPGLLPIPSDETMVVVDVFELVDESLGQSLDRLEGYRFDNPDNSMYIRSQVRLQESDEMADIYYYNGRNLPAERLIASGDWLNQRPLK